MRVPFVTVPNTASSDIISERESQRNASVDSNQQARRHSESHLSDVANTNQPANSQAAKSDQAKHESQQSSPDEQQLSNNTLTNISQRNRQLAQVLEASGLSSTVASGVDMSKPLPIALNQQGQLTVADSADPNLAKLVSQALPDKPVQISSFTNAQGQDEALLVNTSGTGAADTKALLRQGDGSIAILTHSQTATLAQGEQANHSLQTGTNGQALLQSVSPQEQQTTRMTLPDASFVNAINGVHQSTDGQMLRVADNQVFAFSQEQGRWQATEHGQGADSLLTGSNGDIYQRKNGKLENAQTQMPLSTAMPHEHIRHISDSGTLVGLKASNDQTGDNAMVNQILLGKMGSSEFSTTTIPLPPNSHILDAVEADGNIWLSVAQQDNEGNAKPAALFKVPISGDMEDQLAGGYNLEKPQPVTMTNMGDALAGYKIDSFVPQANGEFLVRLTNDEGQHLAKFDTQTGAIGTTELDSTPSSWAITGATLLENGKGLPQTQGHHEVQLNNNTQLLILDGSIQHKDTATGELHATNIDSGAQSLGTDTTGNAAFALINGKVQQLQVSGPQQQFDMSEQASTSLAKSAGTQVSTNTTLPGDNIQAFAALSANAVVQVKQDSNLQAVVNGKIVDLSDLPPLNSANDSANNSPIKQIALDKEQNLYALNESGQLFKLPAEALASKLSGQPSEANSSQDAASWQPVAIPAGKTVKELGTGAQATAILDDSDGNSRKFTLGENGLQASAAKAKPTAFEDFANRGDQQHVRKTNRTNQATGEAEVEITKRQAISTRTRNVTAHLADATIGSVMMAGKALGRMARGTEHTRNLAAAAKDTHTEFKALRNQLQNQANAEKTNGAKANNQPAMTDRIQALASQAPDSAQALKAMQNTLIEQLENVLTQAGIERGVLEPQTRTKQLTNKHVGKEFGGEKDLINVLKNLKAQMNLGDDNRLNTLLNAFHESNQGLKTHNAVNPKQPHSLRNLQIAKQHIELITVKLAALDEQISKIANADGKLSKAEDKALAKAVQSLQSDYENNPIAKESRKGIGSYKQALTPESTLDNILSALDKPNSALSRSIRAKVGAKDHADTLAAMRQVAATIPEGSSVQLGKGVSASAGYGSWRLGLPTSKDVDQAVQLAAFTEVEGNLSKKDGMTLSVAANGDLHIGLSKTKAVGVSALTAGAASIGNGKTLFNAGRAPIPEKAEPGKEKPEPVSTPLVGVGDPESDYRARFKMLLRFQGWFEAAIGASKEKGATLVIPADKKDQFLDSMFGGNAKAQVNQMLDTASEQTQRERNKFHGEVGGYLAAAVRAYADADLLFGRDAQPYVRVQAELDGRMKFAEVDYESLVEQGNGSYHQESTDQMLHLLPSGYVRARVAEYHSLNLQAGDSFAYGGKPGTAENGGTGISENYYDVGNTPLEKKLLSFDNKRDTKFDGTAQTAGEISRDDYRNNLQNLALAFKDSHPAIANQMATAAQMMQTAGDNFAEQAKPAVNIAMTLLEGARAGADTDNATDNTTDNNAHSTANGQSNPQLNAQQLASLNALALLDIHKQAHDNQAMLQNNVQHTMTVDNFALLQNPGKVNELASKVGIGPQIDGTAQLAQLIQNSPDLQAVVAEAAQIGGQATLKMGFNADVQKRVDELAASGELTEAILNDLRAGKGNLVKTIAGKAQVVPNQAAGKANLVPVELSVATSNMRERNFDTQTPYLKVGAQTSVGSNANAMTIRFDYQPGSDKAQGFTVEQQQPSSAKQRLSPENMAMQAAQGADVRIHTVS